MKKYKAAIEYKLQESLRLYESCFKYHEIIKSLYFGYNKEDSNILIDRANIIKDSINMEVMSLSNVDLSITSEDFIKRDKK